MLSLRLLYIQLSLSLHLDIMTLCCYMAVTGYISNGPQATGSHCCSKVTQVKDTHMHTHTHSHKVGDSIIFFFLFSQPSPKDPRATGHIALSRHLVTTLGLSVLNCVCLCVCVCVCVCLWSHIDVTWRSAKLIAGVPLTGGRVTVASVPRRRSFASRRARLMQIGSFPIGC